MENCKWVIFVLVKEGEKTNIWNVATKDGLFKLGEIKWYPQWRTYSFFPYPDTVFENDCLLYIAGFIQDEMEKRRRAEAKRNLDKYKPTEEANMI